MRKRPERALSVRQEPDRGLLQAVKKPHEKAVARSVQLKQLVALLPVQGEVPIHLQAVPNAELRNPPQVVVVARKCSAVPCALKYPFQVHWSPQLV